MVTSNCICSGSGPRLSASVPLELGCPGWRRPGNAHLPGGGKILARGWGWDVSEKGILCTHSFYNRSSKICIFCLVEERRSSSKKIKEASVATDCAVLSAQMAPLRVRGVSWGYPPTWRAGPCMSCHAAPGAGENPFCWMHARKCDSFRRSPVLRVWPAHVTRAPTF